MAQVKRYAKGIATAAGLVALASVAFVSQEYWANRTTSPHYVDGACAVCHAQDTTLRAPEGVLCTSCHGREGETYVQNVEGRLIKIDLGSSHPWGVIPEAKNTPKTLPLYEWEMVDGKLVNGKVVCSTCHDVHVDNADSRMLRLGNDEDWDPLCADCHGEKF